MIGLVYLASRRRELVPRGVQNLLEAIIEGFYNLVVSIAGEKNGRRFFPVVATIFFFVLFANWFSLFPVFNVIGLGEEKEHGFVMEEVDVGPLPVTFTQFSRLPYSPPFHFNLDYLKGRSIDEDDPEAATKAEQEKDKGNFVGEIRPFLRGINTDLNTPLALAIMSAIFVEFWGISTLGFFAYGRKFFNFGGLLRGIRRLSLGQVFQGVVDAFVGFLELVSEMVRLISFTFRLFGNMFAGEVVILMFTFLIPLVFTLPFYGLELFVGLIQAFIFAALTLVFGMIAVTHGGSPDAEEAEAEVHQAETAEGRSANPEQ
jgi:F-type H+-transporting ATPase subunit a